LEHFMTVQVSWTLNALVAAYKQHQRRTRGLRESSLQRYEGYVRLLVREVLGSDPVDVTRLGPSDVIKFVTKTNGRFRPRTMGLLTTSLRSFFRFLRMEGLCDGRLEAAVPTVAQWRLASLPRGLSDEQHARLLSSSFDPTTPCALRNRAIVLCISALGLRPGEVAGLSLDDVDWHAGTLHVRTRKTRRGAVLPLPRDVGRAFVAYLRRERPETPERHVFVRLGGKPVTRCVVSDAVRSALARAGVEAPIAGAYVLRHTLASRMVQHGTSLKEVADFLGHRSLNTTTIYAKLDLPALREVALPWPEVTR
jgi:site-specific recombinase XerD